MEAWAKKTLGELVTLQRGIDLPDTQRRSGNVPVMGSFGITGRHDIAACQGPGVTVGRSGASIGSVTYIAEDYWPLNTCLYVKDFHGNNPRFAYYLLKTLDLAAHNSGSAQPSLNRNFIHPLPVRFPNRTEQDLIVALLGALDDKIELNRRMNETLEAMARAIFKDWFVDFGPTRAKMEGRAPYLAPDLWALFPDRLDEEDKPEGWRYGTFSEVAVSKGQVVTFDFIAPETPYIGLEHMPRKSIALDQWETAEKITSSKSRFSEGDTLFGKLRPYFHKVGTACVNGVCSTDIIVLNGRQEEYNNIVLYCASQDDFVAYADRGSDGTKMPRTSWSKLSSYPLALTPRPIAVAFQSLTEPTTAQIRSHVHANHTLARTRDLLLPKLMSGEIRIKDAEEIVGAVL